MAIDAAENMIGLVGNTPLVHLNKVVPASSQVYGKLEFFNPASSVKDRIAKSMILDAEEKGKLTPGMTVLEPTSGNTGIALAWVCAIKGYRLILTMPETMSSERTKMLKTLGAEIILTPAEKGMSGAMDKVRELAADMERAFVPSQFENFANPEVHRRTTAEEIWEDTGGAVDIVVAGIGTGGTITGIGRALKKKNSSVKTVGVEPAGSSVLTGGCAGPHMIMGIGAGFVPGVLNRKVIDEIVTVNDEEAAAMTRRLTREEGIIAGISSGAAVHVAASIAQQEGNREKVIVVVVPDTGERYLSLALFGE